MVGLMKFLVPNIGKNRLTIVNVFGAYFVPNKSIMLINFCFYFWTNEILNKVNPLRVAPPNLGS